MWQQSEWPYCIKALCLSWVLLADLSVAHWKKEKQNKQSSFILEAGDCNRCDVNTVASDVTTVQAAVMT